MMKDHLVDSLMRMENEEEVLAILEAQLKKEKPAKLFQLLREEWEATEAPTVDESIKEEIWEKLKQAIQYSPIQKQNERPKWLPYLRKALIPAAIVAGIAIFGNLVLSVNNTPLIKGTKQVNQTEMVKEVNMGGNLIAWLRKGGTLEYNRNLIGSVKYTKLSGEAFFVMPPDSDHTLNIEAGPLKIEAFGAEISVDAPIKDNQVRVALINGDADVQFRNKGKNIHNRLRLSAGDELRYNSSDHKPTVYALDTTGVLAWRDEKIAFNNYSLTAAFTKLGNHFDVEFEYDPMTIENCYTNNGPYPITFEKTESLEKILSTILSKKLKFKIEGSKVTISGKGCVID